MTEITLTKRYNGTYSIKGHINGHLITGSLVNKATTITVDRPDTKRGYVTYTTKSEDPFSPESVIDAYIATVNKVKEATA